MSEQNSQNEQIQNELDDNKQQNMNENVNQNDYIDQENDNNQYDYGSEMCQEENTKPFKENSKEEESYEADFQQTTVYHLGENLRFIKQKNGRHMNEYELLEKLGKGSFGKVKKVERKYLDEDGETVLKSFYAAKTEQSNQMIYKIYKQIFNKNQLEYERVLLFNDNGESQMTNRLHLIDEEIKIYKHLNHPNICKLYQVIDDETDEKMYMILEYCDLSQLMIWNEDDQQYDPNNKLDDFICSYYNIQEQDKNIRREMCAKVIFKQISQGIRYLHERNIVNRDIKIDNILCKSDEEKGSNFKLADFSTAKQLHSNEQKLKDCAGTNGFRCPEQQFSLDVGYDGKASDIWSLGISIITYINYQIPFWSDSCLKTDIAAKNEPIKYQQHNSQQLKDLVESMCKKQEINRIKIDEVISHPFFNFNY